MSLRRAEFTNPLYLGALALALVLCLFNFSVLRALGYSIVKPLFRIFLSVEPEFNYYDETQLKGKKRLLVAAVAWRIGRAFWRHMFPRLLR